jgi:hypothetical protein
VVSHLQHTFVKFATFMMTGLREIIIIVISAVFVGLKGKMNTFTATHVLRVFRPQIINANPINFMSIVPFVWKIYSIP